MERIPAITPELIVSAYGAGAFPMADERGVIRWFSPDPRCVIDFERVHVPRSLRQTIRRGKFDVRVNTAFEHVIASCAERDEGTWISRRIKMLYCELHRMGFAHSVESWREGELAGGLYGVSLGGAFFGESMFHRAADASKVALIALVERLRARGFALLDVQWPTPHLQRFGAVEIPRAQYLARLAAAIDLPCSFVP